MALELKKTRAALRDVVSVEDAEALLEWLQKRSAAKLDLSGCTHLHPASLQVLMAGNCAVVAWPADTAFAAWLKTALNS